MIEVNKWTEEALEKYKENIIKNINKENEA